MLEETEWHTFSECIHVWWPWTKPENWGLRQQSKQMNHPQFLLKWNSSEDKWDELVILWVGHVTRFVMWLWCLHMNFARLEVPPDRFGIRLVWFGLDWHHLTCNQHQIIGKGSLLQTQALLRERLLPHSNVIESQLAYRVQSLKAWDPWLLEVLKSFRLYKYFGSVSTWTWKEKLHVVCKRSVSGMNNSTK